MQKTSSLNINLPIPKTEGIKYAGSKLKIIPHILDLTDNLKFESVLDGFSGTTRVSQAFAQRGKQTTANDISDWSEVFATCYLLSQKEDSFYQPYLDILNSLKGQEGWFTEYYGGDEKNTKRPFQRHNTLKLDAIRQKIDEFDLEWVDKCVLLTSLILALDSVDNTLGHYVAYLSKWSPRSYNTMQLTLPHRIRPTQPCRVSKSDIFEAVKDYHDLVYLDPPYGSNNEKMPPSRVRYASYYHIWKSVILNDKPQLFGRANRREDSKDTISASVFEEFRRNEEGSFIAMKAIDRLIAEANAHYILLSYSSGGRATKAELSEIIHSHGKLLRTVEIDYKRNVMGNMTWTNEWLNDDGKYKEYLFLIEK